MTDSMKFGPEWLRNMSGDTASSNNSSSAQVTNLTGVFTPANTYGINEVPSVNNANNSNSSNLTASSLFNNVSAANTGSSRNTFPEFRYGREEMLLLFDRNCGTPEILPSFKNLFVERVQFPLALVPSTDEEMMQGTIQTAQRPGWLQRSPVGFSTPTRGTGRIGCMERGRMRGKSVYHPVFQKPNVMFDEEQRASAIKADRSWIERNGGISADSTVIGASTVSGGGLGSDAWNGNTPISSPRREFSNHPRNIENWRRSRNEDISGSESSAPATFSTEGGWRINTSGFQNSHTRWGRSTSWRDGDLPNTENTVIGGAGGSIGSAVGGGGTPMLPRSNSTISTIHGERIGQSATSGKSAIVLGAMRTASLSSPATRNSISGNIWPNNSPLDPVSNMQAENSANDELALPEWAMENPSDIGGTFDATGAFHGAVDDDENTVNSSEKRLSTDSLHHAPREEKVQPGTELHETFSKTSDSNSIKSIRSQNNSSQKENDIYQDSSSSPTPTSTNENTELSKESDKSKHNDRTTHNVVLQTNMLATENVSQKNLEIPSDNEHTKELAANCTIIPNYSTKPCSSDNNTPISNIGDYAERMMKVTDDMIEKLIMDDEDAKVDHIKPPVISAGNKINSHNMFMKIEQSKSSNYPSTVSPRLGGTGSAVPPNMGLYNMGGIMVDHGHNMAALHQLQQQQIAVAIGLQPTPPPPHPMTPSTPSDLWLYRDPQAKVQGPFSALEMTEWYRAGYFNENLFVRRVCDARFRPLGELIKICNGQMPFNNSHLIPIDLNPTTLTPPLPAVISTQPSIQATDFLLKTLNDHQQHEKLKGNVTAAADSLSNALKTLINSVDISHALNMHFQTLQDRFIHNQEVEIVNELSKNECFRRLSPAEQDTVVRQKLQTLCLPEYLTNLTGLSNSLAALNPTAGTQLYDTIVECTKKEQVFSNHHGQQPSQVPASQQHKQQQQHQRSNIHTPSPAAAYMSVEDFLMKNKTSGSDMSSNDLLNDFSMRLFLNNGSDSGAGNGFDVVTTNSRGHELLNDPQLFNSGSNITSNPSNNASQSPMIQMWMSSLATNPTNSLPNQQHSLLNNAQHPNVLNNQWLNGPLVGINPIGLSTEQQDSPKPMPTSMWDVTTLDQNVQVQQQQHDQHQIQQQQPFQHKHHSKDNEKHIQDHDLHHDVSKLTNKQENMQEMKQQLQKVSNELQKCHDVATKVSSSNDNNYKQDQKNLIQNQQIFFNEKPNLHINNNKRNTNTNNISAKPTNKSKNELLVEPILKKTEEDRRRELNEEKRRQKEERKRQQMEEEKRRVILAEEEKRRQHQEEEKRQQQIQAQRRKALMSNNTNNSSVINRCNANNLNNVSDNSVVTAGNSRSKEQQRIQSSVAPWSSQTMATKLQGPGLAEIQKAERRERRADQQRQLEIQEKQLRTLAAAAEAQDAVLKWNAAPLPVKSFAEIQAEEAKRLVHEQMGMQRRKEQEAHNNLSALTTSGNGIAGGLTNSSNIESIWSGNKIWGTSANTSGFWEDPLRFNKSLSTALSNSNTVSNNNNTNVNLGTASIVSQLSNLQQKLTTTQQQHSSAQPSTNKNIKKSQSVAVMQNTVSVPVVGSSSGTINLKKPYNSTTPAVKPTKLQKPENNNFGGSTNENKKTTSKINNTANKGDDYETEFTNWCTKSLNNMNTKVDVPTFVSFLRDLESPFEVKDYIRMYLGESKEYIDFAKQFLERRSKYKNLQRAQNAHDDDLCKPAQAITPSVNDNSDSKGKQKKVKKNKMTKLDARILGFSVTAAEGRINVGDRDYVDGP